MSVCEIVSVGPVQRLGADEVTVPCGTCGTPREMTERNRRRIVAGEAPNTCERCRSRPHAVAWTERDLCYWLRRFGCDVRGRTAAQYVKKHGLPPELANIIESIDFDILLGKVTPA